MSTQFDKEKSEAYDKTPEARLDKLEMEQLSIKVDIAVLKETCATKVALSEMESRLRTEMAEMESRLKTQIAETKSTIIIWVVSSVFLAQLIPALLKYLLL
ncbi:hypothetical protein [Duganella radicis]|uniref:DUF1640 domain-containing protein n=1 Tax=Duganella radicis TaxID=551988 RepID=A0A6L6PG35_9BURK|nr:hypothetical protein [Duganella radicis]MTV37953.1 hypothetical protein [Duganella radicis]